ncbi:mitochondrial ribosomal subunit protein-domain-containing protein [Aspergillus coremiiformis]|uniref:Mitochondrial ribosomal subunit protein-domain-containing protein n=1 Tax=Aspergillus coremiiformis TaxID=138285 RepID=A0A5N6YZM6_9EURO|nr:mitochondrial ribosomal subunit protein-domain-containing protein [Aspergillus coremiiformis]
MASAARYLGRSALFMARRGPIAIPYRSFSATTPTFASEDPPVPPPPREPRPEELPPVAEYSPDLLTEQERSMYDMLSPEEQEQFNAENRRMVEEFNDPRKRAAAFAEIEKSVNDIEREIPLRFDETRTRKLGFWGEEEDDEFCHVEDADEDFHDDDITSMAHAQLEVHREIREYARIAAWDMPLLSKLAKPFTLPPPTHILRFRYTTYMGESHPAENKIVVELCSQDLTPKYLSEAQRQTFLKLVGPRYNPDTDIVRMSCEKFATRAQNKRYLGDIIDTLIKEAKEGDAFTDVPLDLRHHKPKPKLRFPDSWKMTEERKKQIEARRADRLRQEKERAGIVDGKTVIADAIKILPALNPALKAKATEEREKVAVRVAGKAQKKRLR